MQHGPEWMEAAAKQCLRRDDGDQVQLKLADWVRACHRFEDDKRWQSVRKAPRGADP